jgi:hypothetical protein
LARTAIVFVPAGINGVPVGRGEGRAVMGQELMVTVALRLLLAVDHVVWKCRLPTNRSAARSGSSVGQNVDVRDRAC